MAEEREEKEPKRRPLSGYIGVRQYPTVREAIGAAYDQVMHRNDEPPAVAGPEGPLPRTWKEAIPYVVWVVLILGFGLEFVNALTHAEWLRAVACFAGLGAMMAGALHWRQVQRWTARTNPNFAFVALALLLAGIILSPFVEERRLPFSAWREPADSQSTEAQKAALVDWLQKAQAERNSAQNGWGADRRKLDSLESELANARRQIDALQHPAGTVPTWLKLDFDYQGVPKETGSANVHWWWWNPPENAGGLGSLYQTPSLLGNQTTVLFLSFDRPVRSEGLSLKSSSGLPRWEVAKRIDDRIAVIWIHGQMIGGSLEIEVAK